MSLASENLMRLAGSGYGGGQGVSPYNLHASLLADATAGLQTKRYKDEFGLQKERFDLEQKRFDELVREANFRSSMNLAQQGFGTQRELNEMGQPYNLSYGTGGVGGGLGMGGVSTGLESSRQPVDMASILSQYQETQPYAWRTSYGDRNPAYDPNMANINKTLARILAQYRG